MPTGRHAAHRNPTFVAGVVAAGAGPRARRSVPVDFQSRDFAASEGTPDGGQALITLPIPQENLHYEVEIISIESDSTNACTASVYVGPTDGTRVDYAPDGTLAIASEVPAIKVPTGLQFSILWSGLSAGATCRAHIQWSTVMDVEG